jgi:hypothetical protein
MNGMLRTLTTRHGFLPLRGIVTDVPGGGCGEVDVNEDRASS